jgi:cell division initiation protein
MIENEEFEEEGNYEIKEEVSKEKAEKRVSGEKVDKLEGLGIENNFKIKETEDDQRYQ